MEICMMCGRATESTTTIIAVDSGMPVDVCPECAPKMKKKNREDAEAIRKARQAARREAINQLVRERQVDEVEEMME